jgi:hypothetical protein
LIASSEPAINERFSIGFWIVVVTVHDVLALDHDFTDIAGSL